MSEQQAPVWARLAQDGHGFWTTSEAEANSHKYIREDIVAAELTELRTKIALLEQTIQNGAEMIRTAHARADAAEADAARYRYLKDHCSSHYAMTWEQPAEWSIGWEFQQCTPAEATGSFDHWIDRDIEAAARAQAEIDAEDETSYVAAMNGERENALGPCPECGAPAGMDCRTVQGRIPPHEARCGSERRPDYD